jgi:hypothetical protein
MASNISLPLEELVREIRARAHLGDERTIVLYGRPLPELAEYTTSQLIERVRELQGHLYAVDSRLDLYEVAADRAVMSAAAAVAMLVDADRIQLRDDGRWCLACEPFGKRYGLSAGERFESQPCAGFCSGVLVAPRVLATAAHCIRGVRPEDRGARLAKIRAVFGFRMQDEAAAATVMPSEYVYQPTRVMDIDPKADWILLELDRDVVGVPPACIRTKGRIADGAAVAVIGHPCGLPTKYAPGARVRANGSAAFFRADLDAFGGNSGSPVFGADWTVEGLLVRGAPDFVSDGAGTRALVIPVRNEQDDPPGEDCVRSTLFAAALERS